MPIISLEGSIGAGKTTFLKQVEQAGYHVLYEPVDKWNSDMIDGSSMFELYYKDKTRYGFPFQMYVLQSRVQHLLETIRDLPENAVLVTERCPLTDCKIFAEMMHAEGFINDYSFRVYTKWYEFTRAILPPIVGVAYLRVSPDVCVQRILKRNRSGEALIDLNYLKTLHTKHEDWLMKPGDLPVCVIDGDGSVPDVAKLSDFISQLGLEANV